MLAQWRRSVSVGLAVVPGAAVKPLFLTSCSWTEARGLDASTNEGRAVDREIGIRILAGQAIPESGGAIDNFSAIPRLTR